MSVSARLASLRYLLTNLLLVSFIAALLMGGWLIWVPVILAMTINPTFETYHVHGHHRNVGTFDDASTARRGEYALAFVIRTVIEQSIAGWRIEAERLRGRKTAVLCLHNRVGSGLFFSLVIVGVAAVSAGVAGIIAFLAAAAFGRLLHELLNYVQHYGLVRVKGTSIEARHS